MPWSSEIFKGALYVNKSLSMQEWCVKDCVCVFVVLAVKTLRVTSWLNRRIWQSSSIFRLNSRIQNERLKFRYPTTNTPLVTEKSEGEAEI